jgi:hypothetical protein
MIMGGYLQFGLLPCIAIPEGIGERYFIKSINHVVVWLDRGARRALHLKSSIRRGDSRGRLL